MANKQYKRLKQKLKLIKLKCINTNNSNGIRQTLRRMDEQKRIYHKEQIYYEHPESAINAETTETEGTKFNVFEWYQNSATWNIWKTVDKQWEISEIDARDSEHFLQSLTQHGRNCKQQMDSPFRFDFRQAYRVGQELASQSDNQSYHRVKPFAFPVTKWNKW